MSLAERITRFEADPRFRRAALRFWPTRMIARRRAATLFDLCAGFVYSQILASVIRLGLPGALLRGPCELPQIAQALDLDDDSADRLLRAACALRIARSERGPGATMRYCLGPIGAALIDNDGVAAMIEHHALAYDDLADPVALLRGVAGDTRLGRFWAYAGAGQAGAPDAAAYSKLMSRSQAMLSELVLDAYPFPRHRSVLDVGGGDGSFLRAVASRSPGASLTLFDLPAVTASVEARAQTGLEEVEMRIVAGDMRRDPLPAGSDLVTFVRVLHDHDDATVHGVLSAARRALSPGGRVLIAEPMAGTRGAVRAGDAYFGFYLLAMHGRASGSGQPRSPGRLRAMLRDCGFTRTRLHPTAIPMLSQVLTARA